MAYANEETEIEDVLLLHDFLDGVQERNGNFVHTSVNAICTSVIFAGKTGCLSSERIKQFVECWRDEMYHV